MNINEIFESPGQCPECGGISFSDLILAEKKDACYHKIKATAKVWPSAYASGRLVQCRKKGAANYGNKSEGVAEGEQKPGVDYRDPKEVNYNDDYDAMVARVKRLAGLGPMKTTYDPAKRVYRNQPTAVQPPRQSKK